MTGTADQGYVSLESKSSTNPSPPNASAALRGRRSDNHLVGSNRDLFTKDDAVLVTSTQKLNP